MSNTTKCDLCGTPVRVVGSDEGTQHYEPVESQRVAELEAERDTLLLLYGWTHSETGPAWASPLLAKMFGFPDVETLARFIDAQQEAGGALYESKLRQALAETREQGDD